VEEYDDENVFEKVDVGRYIEEWSVGVAGRLVEE
jgi:hypothetical protein